MKVVQTAAGPLGGRVVAIDVVKRLITRDGLLVHLTRKEYDLVFLLAKYADRVDNHRTPLMTAWGPAHVDDLHYLRVFIGQVRSKIKRDPADPRIIQTEAGVGYRSRPSNFP